MRTIDPEQMAELTRRFFAENAEDPRLAERLARAQTTVHVRFSDDAGITLHMDRSPIQVEAGLVGAAEIELQGTPETFLAFVRGERHMAMAITSGELEYRGPVRKFLRILPILRTCDFSVWRGVGRPAEATA